MRGRHGLRFPVLSQMFSNTRVERISSLVVELNSTENNSRSATWLLPRRTWPRSKLSRTQLTRPRPLRSNEPLPAQTIPERRSASAYNQLISPTGSRCSQVTVDCRRIEIARHVAAQLRLRNIFERFLTDLICMEEMYSARIYSKESFFLSEESLPASPILRGSSMRHFSGHAGNGLQSPG